MSRRWETNNADPPSSGSDNDEDEDDSMCAEDQHLSAERLHEKWENTPATQVPFGVRCRLWSELGVDIGWNHAKEAIDGWDIEMWSRRKRRRIQELARVAVDEERTACAMRCVCVNNPPTRCE